MQVTCRKLEKIIGQKGFTLIELLIVVAILGVLVAVAAPSFTKILGTADIAAANTEADAMRTGILTYNVVKHSYPEGTYGKGNLGELSDYISKSLIGSYTVSTLGELTGTGGWSGLKWESGQWVTE